MSEPKTFKLLLKTLESFAQACCAMKLAEMFPNHSKANLDISARDLVCFCLPEMGRHFSDVPMYTIMIRLMPDSNVGAAKQSQVMCAFCLQVMGAIDLYYEAISDGAYDATDFFKHTRDGQGES